ncbi:MAG: hypothetical protein LBU14_01730 [Candidatus Peribacteria bacterium]|jgi:hypothetical protein|nr:hypothetical protein [Candidatus Peribacteria bacterium]
MFTSENHLCCIASFTISFISVKLFVFTIFANLHQATFANSIGLIGLLKFQLGVVLVLAQIGVVGLACPVVKA